MMTSVLFDINMHLEVIQQNTSTM